MALTILLILYAGIAAVGLVLCALAFVADPSPRALAEILAIAVPLVLLWPWILLGHVILGAIGLISALARRLIAR